MKLDFHGNTNVMTLGSYSDIELLAELIKRNGTAQGPTKTEYADTIRETVIGIGKDNIATIRLHTDDLAAMKILLEHKDAA